MNSQPRLNRPEIELANPTSLPANLSVPIIRPAKSYGVGSMIGAAIVMLLLAALGYGATTNSALGWPTVAQYFFSRPILDGVMMTLILTAISMLVAVLLGTILAIMRMSSNPVLRASSVAYSWFFRGIPVLVQLIFWFNMALLVPRIAVGLPGSEPWYSIKTNLIITPFTAAILGLGLSMAAYMAEVVRGGILSVGSGQIEAARSLGMTRSQALRRVILPQAMRVVLPPMGNELIGLLKWTSLASVIAVSELMEQSTLIYSRNFQVIPLLLVAAFWYLLITTVFSFGQRFLENHFGKSDRR
jgi:polar amino acid transport system permease protein